jgi:hypothetical protein
VGGAAAHAGVPGDVDLGYTSRLSLIRPEREEQLGRVVLDRVRE